MKYFLDIGKDILRYLLAIQGEVKFITILIFQVIILLLLYRISIRPTDVNIDLDHLTTILCHI